MQIIKPEITKRLREVSKARFRLGYEFDVYETTIDRWLDGNDRGEATNLTTPTGLRAIAEELDMPKENLICDFEEGKAA